MRKLVPHPIRVVSSKYDGTPRDHYNAELLEERDGVLVVRTLRGMPIHSSKAGVFAAEDSAVELYFTQRWYNVRHLLDGTAYDNAWYANISCPALFDGESLRWTDLYLDVRCHLNGRLEVLDEDEFEEARQTLNMPLDVVAKAREALSELLQLAQSGAFPFNHAVQMRRLHS